jgi:hypothetical protein
MHCPDILHLAFAICYDRSGKVRSFHDIMPGLDMRLGHYSFEEVIKIVYHEMRLETDKS